MKLKKVCLLLLVVLLVLLLKEINCIANYQQNENLIADEDRRGAATHDTDQKLGAYKRGLYETSGTHNNHHAYPSGYGDATFTNPGYAYGTHAVQQYYPTTGHGSYGLLGHAGHAAVPHASYGHSPSYGHEHGGYNALALKGLLIPLAGIALLGAAAALSTNPVLLQLGVVNGRRRRRRSLNSTFYPNNPHFKSHKNHSFKLN